LEEKTFFSINYEVKKKKFGTMSASTMSASAANSGIEVKSEVMKQDERQNVVFTWLRFLQMSDYGQVYIFETFF
jgi:hypothetical protein